MSRTEDPNPDNHIAGTLEERDDDALRAAISALVERALTGPMDDR